MKHRKSSVRGVQSRLRKFSPGSKPKSPPTRVSAVRKAPAGKGIFVRGIASVGGVQRIVDVAVWAGLRWVAVQSWWKDQAASGSYNPNGIYMPQLAAALRERGIDFWVWGWGYPSQNAAFAQTVGGAARLGKGAILDLEGEEWNNQDAAVEDLVTRMRTELQGRGLGLTSYGRPSNFPQFPWSTATLFDFGMPQLYLGHQAYGIGYLAEGVADYTALGFEKVIPILGAYDLSAAEMTQLYGVTPRPAGAVAWWDFTNADNEPSRWYAIQGAPI